MKVANRLTKSSHPWGKWPMELDHLLDQFFGDQGTSGDFAPRTDVSETEKEFLLTLELPGLDADQVQVEVQDGRLTISGEKAVDRSDESSTYHRVERATGAFQRTFEFPVQVDFDKIDATFKNGILSVALPKSEKVLPRKIQIKQAN